MLARTGTKRNVTKGQARGKEKEGYTARSAAFETSYIVFGDIIGWAVVVGAEVGTSHTAG